MTAVTGGRVRRRQEEDEGRALGHVPSPLSVVASGGGGRLARPAVKADYPSQRKEWGGRRLTQKNWYCMAQEEISVPLRNYVLTHVEKVVREGEGGVALPPSLPEGSEGWRERKTFNPLLSLAPACQKEKQREASVADSGRKEEYSS